MTIEKNGKIYTVRENKASWTFADYLSAVVVALSGFGFFNVIVTFTLSTAVWLSIAFAKSCKAFFIASTLLTSFAFLDYIISRST